MDSRYWNKPQYFNTNGAKRFAYFTHLYIHLEWYLNRGGESKL